MTLADRLLFAQLCIQIITHGLLQVLNEELAREVTEAFVKSLVTETCMFIRCQCVGILIVRMDPEILVRSINHGHEHSTALQ